MRALGVIALVLVVLAIALPAAQDLSADGPPGHHVSVRHAPRTPSSSARTAAVSGLNEQPRLFLSPTAPLSSLSPVAVASVPLTAPFVPPRG